MTLATDLTTRLRSVRSLDEALAVVFEAADELDRLSTAAANTEALAVLASEVLSTFTDRGSLGGVDSHLRSHFVGVARVNEWRARLAEARP